MIGPIERDLIAIWADNGIPSDASTLNIAGRVLRDVLAEADQWNRIIDQLADSPSSYVLRLHQAIHDATGECVPCVLGEHGDCVAASTDVCGCCDRDHDADRSVEP